MLSVWVAIALIVGILLGILLSFMVFKSQTSVGDFVIKRNEEGLYSYVLQLEEEPEVLHKRRRIIFKVNQSH